MSIVETFGRERAERLAAMLRERLRRRNLCISKEGSLWYDIETGEEVSEAEIVKREVRFEQNRVANDVKSKVIVDRAWLEGKLGKEAYLEAIASRHVQPVDMWL